MWILVLKLELKFCDVTTGFPTEGLLRIAQLIGCAARKICFNQSESRLVLVVTHHQCGISVVVPQASFRTKSGQWWNSEISVVFSGFQPVYNNNNIVYYIIKKVFHLLWQRHSV